MSLARLARPPLRLRASVTVAALTLASTGAVIALAAPASAATTFSNTTAINVADANGTTGAPGTGSLYPSNIVVSGQSGTISHLTVTLNNVSHPFANDFDVLLVGPNGAKFEVVSDAGGGSATSNVTATFDDNAASHLASGGNWGAASSSVTVQPSNVDSGSADTFPAPAPVGPYLNPDNGVFFGVNSQSLDAAFGGLSPNGTWSLYVVDDTSADTGSIAGGWAINVTVASAAATTTIVTSSTNPSTTGSAVTFSAHVVDNTSANVTTGTVSFKDGGISGTTLASGVALNASGVASFSTSALTEGAHIITAIYSGTASFATSNGSLTQVVDNPTTQSGNTYSNSGAIAINDFNVGSGAGFPYPSHINVSGVSGAISNVTVRLTNVSHPDVDDIDALLVGPSGQKLIFFSDAGSASSATTNATLTFDDGAANQLPASGPLTTGTFRPTDYNSGTDSFPSPAPASASAAAPQGAATLTSVFGGVSPNGQWSLYVVDDSAGGSGNIAGGWALTFTTTSDAATTTTLTSSANPSITGSSVTFTAHVTQTSNGNDVAVGTVTFKDGSTSIGSPVPLSGSGTASVSTSSLAEGSHTITAAYSGSPGNFNLSSGTLTQQVDSPTVVSGTTFCNNGGLAIQSAVGSDLIGTASVYPSHLNISGTSGNLLKLTATIKGLTHGAPDDIDMLLVSPSGTTLKLMSDAGGLTAISNVNITLDDAAASLLPDSTAIGSGTYRPSDYEAGDTFPSPAPSGPYGSPAPAGTATLASMADGSANGTWSLYVVDDSAGLDGSITGWCLNLSLPPTANDDAYNAAQDSTLTVPAPGVLGNDTGTPAPTAVAISSGSTTQGGTVTLNTNGSFTYDPPAGFTGTDTFTYTATNGGTDTATVTITVTHKPSITGATVSRQQGSSAANDTIATVSDVETPDGDLTVTANPPPGITLGNITNTGGTVTADVRATCAASTGPGSVPLTVTDGDGLTATDNLTVNVSADTPPTLTYDLAGPAVNAGGGATVDPVSGPSDNGSVASLTVQNVPGTFTGTVTIDGPASSTPGRVHISNANPAGAYTFTLRATDNCGLVTDSWLGLTVNGAPTVDAGADQTVTLASGATLAGSVTDDGRAPGNATATALWSKDSGPGTVTFTDATSPTTHADFSAAGVYVLRLTGDDGQLTTSDTVTITVTSAPVIHVPADITVTESSPGAGTAVTFTVTAAGFPTPTIGCVEGATPVSSGDTFAAGVHTIDCTATNSAGSDSGSFTITVQSVPVIHLPADITVTESSPGAGAAVTFTVTATGTPTPTIECFDGVNPVHSGDTFAAGVHTIDCSATNVVGSDSGSFTITVRSVPVITVPADFTVVENPQGSGSASVSFTVTATGVPTPTIACVIGATPVTSPVTLAIGAHTIDCTATNSVGSDSDSFTVTVVPANHPPVPNAGGPYSVAEGGSLTLNGAGTTDADGDPLTYSWDVNGDGTFGDATGVGPTLTWGQLKALGINDGPASFSVKVRVSDGHVGGTITSAAATLTVTNAAPTGAISGPSDVSAGSALTLSFAATDPSPVDQAAGFDYTVNWGDGSTDGPLHSGSPLTRSHTYAAIGVYTVSMTAKDKDGGTSVAAVQTISVSGAQLTRAVCGSGRDLVVGGTSVADTIGITAGTMSGAIAVKLNNVSLGQFVVTGRVIVFGQSGNDRITVDSKLTTPRLLFGGAGNDTITGGNGAGVQVGGDGSDTLGGGNGRDILIGGAGADALNGDNGDDVLVAGSTSFDDPTAAHLRALCAIGNEWTRTDASYTTRVHHLDGTLAGGLNGTSTLTPTGPGQSVFDDTSKDTVKGALGSDWFLINIAGGLVLDTSDAATGEVRTDIS